MGTITLSVPDELKARMNKTDWVNWSSVARRAFSETLKDVKELQLRKRILEISEIPEEDKREVKESVVKKAVKSMERASKELKSGTKKPITLEEFNKWCEEV